MDHFVTADARTTGSAEDVASTTTTDQNIDIISA